MWSDARTIQLPLLEDDEAIKLLLNENGKRDEDEVYDKEQLEHAKSIVEICGRLPVAVRAAGRLLLSVSSSGDILGLSRLAKLISKTSLVDADQEKVLFETLDRSLSKSLHGEARRDALKACFATFSCIFFNESNGEEWISLQVVHHLWEQLLHESERKEFDLPGKSVTTQIMETLERYHLVDSLAVLNTNGTEKMHFRVHHELLHQYGMQMFSKKEERQRLLVNRISIRSNGGIRSNIRRGLSIGTKRSMSYNTIFRLLHTKLVFSFDGVQVQMNDEIYPFCYLPSHMYEAGMIKMAEEVLRNESFIRRRLLMMGTIKGTERTCKDVEMLQHYIQPESSKKVSSIAETTRSVTDSAFKLISDLCVNVLGYLNGAESNDYEQVGRSYLAMGASLQRQFRWLEANQMLAKALKVYKKGNISENNPAMKEIRDLIHTSALSKITLLPITSPKVVKLKYADKLHAMQHKSDTEDNEGEQIRNSLDAAGVSLELISHPGRSICPLQTQFNSLLGVNFMDLGIGPRESALTVKCDKDCIMRSCDGATVMCQGPSEEVSVSLHINFNWFWHFTVLKDI